MKQDGKAAALRQDVEAIEDLAQFVDSEIVKAGIDVQKGTKYREAFDAAAIGLRERAADYTTCTKSTNSADSFFVCWQQRTLNGRTGAFVQEKCGELMKKARSR
jgi:hypothetical protein